VPHGAFALLADSSGRYHSPQNDDIKFITRCLFRLRTSLADTITALDL
jgi:hypothetical protein